jgi:hypothetical protein
MVDQDKVPDIWEISKKWVFRHFGTRGLIIFILLSTTVVFIFKYSDTISKWPGVATIVNYIHNTFHPIPCADPNRFTIFVAHLENDVNHDVERRIVNLILEEFKEIKVMRLDRTITLEGSDPDKQVKLGHELGQKYLKESGASVLIWGTVLSESGKTAPKLY